MNIIEAAKAALLEEAVPGLFYASKDGLERFAQIIRNQALEDAAKCCDVLAELNLTSPTDSMWEQEECAAAIRSMKKEHPNG